jgi:hypothetical protein
VLGLEPRLRCRECDAISITVLSVKPMRGGKLFALTSELDIDGVRVEIHGMRALRINPVGTGIDYHSAMPMASCVPR